MSKAMLIIDMPEIDEETKIGCRNCRYADCGSIGFFESYKCVLTEQCKNVYDMKCPLKPFPKKKGKVTLTERTQNIDMLKWQLETNLITKG